jgi:hypothetical protein
LFALSVEAEKNCIKHHLHQIKLYAIHFFAEKSVAPICFKTAEHTWVGPGEVVKWYRLLPPPASGRWSDSWHKIKAISGCLMPSLWWMLRWQDGDKKVVLSPPAT